MKHYLCSWKWRDSRNADCLFSPDIAKARVWKFRAFAEVASEDLAAHTISGTAPDGSVLRCGKLAVEERKPDEFTLEQIQFLMGHISVQTTESLSGCCS